MKASGNKTTVSSELVFIPVRWLPWGRSDTGVVCVSLRDRRRSSQRYPQGASSVHSYELCVCVCVCVCARVRACVCVQQITAILPPAIPTSMVTVCPLFPTSITPWAHYLLGKVLFSLKLTSPQLVSLAVCIASYKDCLVMRLFLSPSHQSLARSASGSPMSAVAPRTGSPQCPPVERIFACPTTWWTDPSSLWSGSDCPPVYVWACVFIALSYLALVTCCAKSWEKHFC